MRKCNGLLACTRAGAEMASLLRESKIHRFGEIVPSGIVLFVIPGALM